MKILTIAAMLMFYLTSTGASAADTDTATAPSRDLNFAHVDYVDAARSADGSWCFAVTVRHHDQGWDHYADGWEVVDAQDNPLGARLLAHPHDNEQPFTRSLCGVVLPEPITQVRVRAKCNRHGYGGQSIRVPLVHQNSTEHYSVKF